MPDFGFVGGAYEAPSIYQDAQELINYYCEIDNEKEGSVYYESLDQQQSRGVVALYPTPGYSIKFQLGLESQGVGLAPGEVRGMHVCSGGNMLLVVCSNTLYAINASFNVTVAGTLATNAGPVSIDDNAISAYLVDGPNRYSYVFSTAVFAQAPITDGAFVGADKVQEVDNFFVYNNPGTQQWAATTALSNVTSALSFASKFGYSDQLVSFEVVSRDVFLLGERSSEVWINVGAFPFPFQIIPGTNTQHGCVAKYSVSRLGESFAFVSQDERGHGLVLAAEGYSFKRISTHAVENSLVGQVISDARSFTYQLEGHEFYVVTFPMADMTWVYDLSTNKWNKWLSVDSYNVFHRHRANCYALFQGFNLIGDYQNGNVYALSNTVYQENGNEIRRVRRCPHLVSDFKREFFSALQIQFQPGVGLSTGQGDNPQAMLRWSNDGGSTWSNEHWKSIGLQGRYKNRVIWRRLGWARDRIFEVVITDPIKAVIISANLEASAGDH